MLNAASLNLLPSCIQVADEHGDVGFEQPGSHGDQDQPCIEQGDPFERGEGQGDVAEHHQNRPQPDRVALAEDAVAQKSPQYGDKIDHSQKEAVVGAFPVVVPPEVLLHVQVEDGHHDVEAEPLPHLGEEENHQSPGMIFQHGRPTDLLFTNYGLRLCASRPGLHRWR